MRALTLTIAAAMLAGGASAAIAAPGDAPRAKMARADMTRAQVEAMAAERFAKMDLNGDGVLNAADRAARRAAMFDRIDADKNGSVSRAEFEAMHQGRRGAGQAAHAGHAGMEAGKRAGMRAHRMAARGKMAGARMAMAARADTDKDNALSRAEFTAAALARFDRTDADRNGTVTQAERQAARQAMRAQREKRRATR